MFEVLLQADKALASGALDQAERSYWQLIVLDPTNAIAVAGLARVSLERGDRRLARTFAARALVIDPDSFSAKRIIETLEGRGGKPPASDEPDLPLLAAQHLEALGRRRATGHKGATGHRGPGTHASASAPALPSQARSTKRPETAPEEARKPLPQPPVEPLRGRRQAGRQAAAAATAAAQAAPRSEAPRGAKARQALGDRGRRHPSPEALKPPSRSEDPFAVAESAAAVEAVGEANDVVLAHRFEPGRGGTQSDELGHVLGAVDATDKDESIALRVALVSDAAQLEAAELEAAELDAAELGAELDFHAWGAAQLPGADLRASDRREPEPNEAELEAAEVLAAESIGPAPSPRIDLAALGTGSRVAESRVARGEAVEPQAAQAAQAARTEQAEQAAEASAATQEDGAVQPIESIAPARVDDLRGPESADAEAAPSAAEPASAELAMAQRVSQATSEAEFEAAQLEASGAPIEHPTEPAPSPAPAREVTEQDAEAAALREALAVVLANDTDDAPTEDGAQAPRDDETAAQPSVGANNEPPVHWSDDGGDTAGSEARPQRHRHWLLRRFLGG